MRVRSILALAWAAASGLAAMPVMAFQRFDFDQRYFIEPGYIVKDHTLVAADDGTYHLFYIKADETLPEGQRAKTLGHATTTDLMHWTLHPDVIPVVPGTWEEAFVWAPYIVRDGGMYWMFYTGVNWSYAQGIGVAVSNDLYNWTKYPQNPVYTPSPTWAAWASNTWSNCRDPFVFQEQGVWYMTTTAWTNTSRGAISLASSTDLVHWNDMGPLLVHPGPTQAWHVLESTNLHKYGGKWHLFCTEQNVGGSWYMSAPNFTGPWDFGSKQAFDAGHAIEVFKLDNKWMLSRHTTFAFGGLPRYVLKFDDLDWATASKPVVQWKDPLAEWTVWSGDAFYLQPTFWDNSQARVGEPANFGGNSWIGTAELFTGPLQVGYPGLGAGEEPKGVLRSKIFTITGNRISLRIGGGQDLNKLYVALYTADDGVRRLRATGQNSELMQPVIWDVTAWSGRRVFLEIVDQATGTWGHINVDEIIEYNDGTTDAPAPRILLSLHQNVPNPFNPSTRIRVDIPAAARGRLTVFDVRGRMVREIYSGPFAAGSQDLEWNGRRDDGTAAASGLYLYRLELAGQTPQTRTMVLLK